MSSGPLNRRGKDGEIAGIPREVIETFSTRRAEIDAAMKERGSMTPRTTSAWRTVRRL